MLFTLLAALHAGQALAERRVAIDESQRAAFGIKTAPVKLDDLALSKPYPAKVAVPNAQLQVVGVPLEGVVEAMLVAEGEMVEAGQVLARVRSQGLLQLQATYLESYTRRQLSGETLARDSRLFADGIIANRRLLESQAAHREMLTAEARDRQALGLAGISQEMIKELRHSRHLNTLLEVRSPLSGVVLEQVATAGQRLVVSDPLYKVGDLSTLWVEIHVPLGELGGVGPGSPVELPQGLPAKVIAVGGMVHGTDQGVLVRAEVRNQAASLRPGQFVEARLGQTTDKPSLRLPANALVRVDGVESLFVERPDGYEVVEVKVLAREASDAVVSAPLTADDRVVVEGTVSVKAALAAGAK
ncbi:MAG: efflux RND transporter periplasmic adaptor subunit [Gammaproteobacteria bacterium]|nr:efflux RND transporter periplasmic adaptor subunit [Gammaproteobacteria bacterium]MBU1654361.1 efflux RND transporter periplasmic adaptor subunit [Gammaproteobacteria bacterium]MBU1961988.1 efflux RND transporter periplasmic adaptor subunit [Gammaproteobacteria bacterium]